MQPPLSCQRSRGHSTLLLRELLQVCENEPDLRPRCCPHPSPQVFAISAKEALLSRLVLGGRAEREELDLFRRAAFGRRWERVNDPQLFRWACGRHGKGAGAGVAGLAALAGSQPC